MEKRTFLKLTGLAGAGLVVSPFVGCGDAPVPVDSTGGLAPVVPHTQTPLSYGFGALEPAIDAATMELHYGKHHAGYVRNLNAALEADEARRSMPLEALLAALKTEDAALRNNGGGHFNHELYWRVLQPGGAPAPHGMLGKALMERFGSFEAFREEFAAAGAKRFGSGWAWLVMDASGRLQVTSTANQDNPLMASVVDVPGSPLLGMDVWEHAYYLNYQNRRGDYISAFMSLVNWDVVGGQYDAHFA